MSTFRDWPKTLRPASYRGTGFYVDTDTIETGRRLVEHEFPHADAPYIEDLGRATNQISVTAYVLSDAADREEKALRRACESGGAASLSLPMERLNAHCKSCKRSFAKDKQGLVAFDLAFVRDGLAGGAFPIGFLSSLVRNLAATIKVSSAAAFAGSYRGLRVPGFVADQAASDVRTIAAVVLSTAHARPLEVADIPAIVRGSERLYDAAPVLIRSGALGERLTVTSFAAIAEVVSTEPLVAAIHDLIVALGAATVIEPLATLQPFIDWQADVSSDGLSGWTRLATENTMAIARVVRAAALVALAERIARTRFTDPREARQARADVAELYESELSRLIAWRDHALYAELSSIAGRTADYLSRQITDLAPIIIVSSARAMPSLWWANRLYGDALRAGEIAARNRVKHPSFMPPEFEALAR